MKAVAGNYRLAARRLGAVRNNLRQIALQNIVEARQQMRNRFLSFVAHIRQAEGLATDLSITRIDHQMMFSSQFPRKLQHIDAFIVFDARQCLCAEPLPGEEFEPNATHPIMHERIGANVTGITRFQPFLEDLIELVFERMNVPDARRAGRHPLGLFAPELQEIEIKSAIRNFLRARKGLFRNGEQRKARRQRKRLLRPGKHHVDAERVHVDLHRRERGNRINDERDVRIPGEDAADFRERIHHPGGRFTVGQRDGIEFSTGQLSVEIFVVDVLPPFDLKRLGFLPTTPGDIEPFVGERAAHAIQDFFSHEVANCALHHSPSR